MFGVFQGGQSGTNKSSLPKLEDLIIVYESKDNLSLIPGPTPDVFNYVTRVNNSAPYYLGEYPSVHNLGGSSTIRYNIAIGGGGGNAMFGNLGRYVRMNNVSGQYFNETPSFTVGATAEGFTVVMTQRSHLSGGDFAWRINPVTSGDAITGFFDSWSDAGTARHRYRVTSGSGGSLVYQLSTAANAEDFRRFYAVTTDFSGSANQKELFVSNALGATGGAFVSRDTDTAPNNPDTDYTFQLATSGFDKPSWDWQSIYVWKTKLTSGEITDVQNYLNNIYIPTI